MLLKMIAASSQEECRQIGSLFLSFADKPRDASWEADFQRQLDALPEQVTGRSMVIADARRRVLAEQERLWASGWHPLQMRAILEQAGYTGADDTAPGEVDPQASARAAHAAALGAGR